MTMASPEWDIEAIWSRPLLPDGGIDGMALAKRGHLAALRARLAAERMVRDLSYPDTLKTNVRDRLSAAGERLWPNERGAMRLAHPCSPSRRFRRFATWQDNRLRRFSRSPGLTNR